MTCSLSDATCLKNESSFPDSFSSSSHLRFPYYVIGHRGFGCSSYGAHSIYPENSYAAIQAAVDNDVEAVEIDVWLSRDGEVVVLHDEFIERTVVYDKTSAHKHRSCDGQDCEKCSDHRVSIECLYWTGLHKDSPNGLPLRQPWKLSHSNHSEESYISSKDVYVNESGEHAAVPTLRQILERFAGMIEFNVELKGNNPLLGIKLLEILKDYPSSVIRISSFAWIPPKLTCCDPEDACNCKRDTDNIHEYPNGHKSVDLLEPLINNPLDIPIALLFNDSSTRLPSVSRIVECLDKYNSDWAHIHHKSLIDDSTRGSDCSSRSGSGRLSSRRVSNDSGRSVGSSPTLSEPAPLREVVEELEKHRKKIMTFWPQKGEDKREDIRHSIEAGVAAICPNDPKMALDFLKSEYI